MKLPTIFFFVLFSLYAHSQNHIIGITTTIGQNTYQSFRKLLDDFGADGKGVYDFGLFYNKKTSKKFSISIEPEYSIQKIITTSFSSGYDVQNQYELHIFNLPISLKYDFVKYFFINGGIMMSYDLSKVLDDQTGIGAQLGIGFQFNIKNIYMALNPTIKTYSLIPFKNSGYQYHCMESGLKFMAGYRF